MVSETISLHINYIDLLRLVFTSYGQLIGTFFVLKDNG